jgi:hypothetical protein
MQPASAATIALKKRCTNRVTTSSRLLATDPHDMSQGPARATDSKAVLVTGATGYIGRVLVSALLARGHQVRALGQMVGALVYAVETPIEPGAVRVIDVPRIRACAP